MDKKGPIIVIEDSLADQRIMNEIFGRLNYDNKLLFFNDGQAALDFLSKTEEIPFLILSDINMPSMSGLELREMIHKNPELNFKCVPFLFFSNGADKESVSEAYSLSVQGFFLKPIGIEELESTLRSIVEYWKKCISPGDYYTYMS